MRPVLAGDVFAVAHVLKPIAQGDRTKICARLLEETEGADKYRKRIGALHP